MTKKEIFINEIDEIIENVRKTTGELPLSEDAMFYFESLKATPDKEKKAFTDNGKLILSYMQENKDTYNNLFTAKSIGEGIGISSRSVSGGMRKLVTDEYVEKIGESPITYAITDKGVSADLTI